MKGLLVILMVSALVTPSICNDDYHHLEPIL